MQRLCLSMDKENKDNYLKKAINEYEKELGIYDDTDEAYMRFKGEVNKKNKLKEILSIFNISNYFNISNGGVLIINRVLIGYFLLSITLGIYFYNKPSQNIVAESLIFKSENIIEYETTDVNKALVDMINELNELNINYSIIKDSSKADKQNRLIIEYNEALDDFLFKREIEPRISNDNKVVIDLV